MHLDIWLRWYMVVCFALFGIGMLAWRHCFAGVTSLIRTPPAGEPFAERLRDAIARRERLESLPGAAMASAVAVASLVAALLGAFTTAPTTLLYAGVSLVLALTLATAYVRLRSAGGRRVASLRPRRREAIVPAWLWAAVAVAAVSPLAFIDVAPVAAIVVSFASLTIAFVGDRIARLPALLSGQDPAVDEYVDDRLRAVRTVNIVGTAAAPAYVFEAITAVLAFPHDAFSAVHWTVMGFTLVVLLAAVTVQLSLMRRRPGAPELERWARIGA